MTQSMLVGAPLLLVAVFASLGVGADSSGESPARSHTIAGRHQSQTHDLALAAVTTEATRTAQL